MRLMLAVNDGDGWHALESGLTGELFVERGEFVVAFSSLENAVDCLRMVTQSLKEEFQDA